MKVSPFAGKPAEPSMLVNVPKLITAYYTEVPDPSVPEQRVAFGTSGIAARPSRKLSTNGIFSPSVRPFACIAGSRRSMDHSFSVWTRTRFRCRLLPARWRCWRPTGWMS